MEFQFQVLSGFFCPCLFIDYLWFFFLIIITDEMWKIKIDLLQYIYIYIYIDWDL